MTINDRQKWIRLAPLPARDAQDPELRMIATELDRLSFGRPELFVALALAYAQNAIRYRSDTDRTGGEDIAGITRPYRSILESVRRGWDDCDAKARLFCALLLARGLRAEMVPKWDDSGEILEHVFCRYFLNGRWNWAEPTLRRALLGERALDVPKETRGDWLQ